MCLLILAQEIGNVEERTINVVHTPVVIYEEPGKTTNNAQSDFYSEACMTSNVVTNALYGMNSHPSTNSEYVSYHSLI